MTKLEASGRKFPPNEPFPASMGQTPADKAAMRGALEDLEAINAQHIQPRDGFADRLLTRINRHPLINEGLRELGKLQGPKQ